MKVPADTAEKLGAAIENETEDAQVQFKTGQAYFQKNNILKAEEWYQKAALQGHVDAQFELASLYGSGKLVRKPNFIVPALTVRWMREAAKQGHFEAQFQLAGFLKDGTGTPKDISKSLVWYQRAAYSDHPKAMNELANMYRVGRDYGGPIDKDTKQALFWYEKLAGLGDLNGVYQQGRIYASNALGAPDYAAAMQKYVECGRQEHAGCQRQIADYYKEGKGVPKDTDLALKWYRKALANGNGSSIARIEDIEAERSKAQAAANSRPKDTAELIYILVKALMEEEAIREKRAASQSSVQSSASGGNSGAKSCAQILASNYYSCETYLGPCVQGGCSYEWACRQTWLTTGSNGKIKKNTSGEKKRLGKCRHPGNYGAPSHGEFVCDPNTGKDATSFNSLVRKVCR